MKQTTKPLKTKHFPKVYRLNRGDKAILQIIYKNKIELYEMTKKYTKSQIDKDDPNCNYDYQDIFGKGWNAWHEVDMMQPNGFKEIHAVKDEEGDSE